MKEHNVELNDIEVHADVDLQDKTVRRKRPLELLNGSTGVGNMGLLVLVLNTLYQMNGTVQSNSSQIGENNMANQRVESMLIGMKTEFSRDITRFENEHARLKMELSDLMVKQESVSTRMQGMEGNMRDAWNREADREEIYSYDRELKRWVRENFKPKSLEQ